MAPVRRVVPPAGDGGRNAAHWTTTSSASGGGARMVRRCAEGVEVGGEGEFARGGGGKGEKV